jgi:sRNA-binding protein
MLCRSFPKCFFEDPKQRRPLKHNIAADIIEDPDFQVSPAMITAALEWYTNHVGYDYVTLAGSKRIDLDGREVGTVTEQEFLAAKHRINDYNHRRNELARINPVKVLSDMHASGKISDDAVKKLDATPRGKTVGVAAEFAPLYETLTAANAAVVGISDPSMRSAVAKVLLDEVIKKCQQRKMELDPNGAP